MLLIVLGWLLARCLNWRSPFFVGAVKATLFLLTHSGDSLLIKVWAVFTTQNAVHDAGWDSGDSTYLPLRQTFYTEGEHLSKLRIRVLGTEPGVLPLGQPLQVVWIYTRAVEALVVHLLREETVPQKEHDPVGQVNTPLKTKRSVLGAGPSPGPSPTLIWFPRDEEFDKAEVIIHRNVKVR